MREWMKGYAEGWEGWRKDEWRQCLDKRSQLTTAAALLPSHCTAAGLKFILCFVLLVITDLTLWSFLWLQPHLSWSCLIFFEVLVFCLRLTQMTFQLCGNHRHNCQWCSSIYRCLFSRLVMHSVRLNLSEYAVDKCCPMQIQEKVWWPKGVPLSCLFLQLD